MTQKKKARLGRGLGALLGDVKTTVTDRTVDDTKEKTSPKSQKDAGASSKDDQLGYRELPIEQLQRGKYQPRINMDKAALEELADSIRVQGVVQPLLVRVRGKNKYEIIAGERRWRGAQLAGLSTVPAVVRDIPDQTAMAVGLIENIQREDLNAIEEARGFQRLLDEFGLTHQEIAEAVGRSRTAVSNLIRLLSLHPMVQKQLESGELEMGHARALLALPETIQVEAGHKVISGGLSVRKTEQLVKAMLAADADDTGSDEQHTESNADILRLEDDISTRLGAKVEIQHRKKKGKLVIHYHSLDELDGILERIK
ncbi:MAG: ParB/RepB/Spo0J family partition protein [Gammaproteobacteria bacterium]|nr:ParB/RepB/Spo0J family partition protein [Gammaproteobacteria bacterium]